MPASSRSRSRRVVFLLTVSFAAATLHSQQSPGVDLILHGGWVIDGTGSEARRADVAIDAGRIVEIGDLSARSADRRIDVSERYVVPGFIDLHSHGDEGLSIPALAPAINNVIQGITTIVVGQDGRHAWPLGSSLTDQARRWRDQGIGNNVVPLAGQGSARIEVMGWSREAATPEQTRQMAQRIEALLREGAWGVSSGLGYFPGRHSPPEEVQAAVAPAKAVDGFYISHLRNQDEHLLDSVDETIEVARTTGVRSVVTHIKSKYRQTWGTAPAVVARMQAARNAGLPVFGDVYPYDTDSDGIDPSLAPWSAVVTRDDLVSFAFPAAPDTGALVRWAFRTDPRLAHRYDSAYLSRQPEDEVRGAVLGPLGSMYRDSAAYRQRLREALADPPGRVALLRETQAIVDLDGPEHVRIEHHPDPAMEGRTLADVARRRGLDAAEAAVRLTIEGARFTQFNMSEPDVEVYLQQPFIAGSTDGWIPEYGGPVTHPRSYGSFTRRIRRYVFERAAVDLPTAIRGATGLAADIIGLPDRGYLRQGYHADVVVFDPLTIRDRATYAKPHQLSEGLDWVLINGVVVVERGRPLGVNAGRVLLKTGP